VLPFHRLAAHKYRDLGLRFPLADVEPPDAATVTRVLSQFREAGLVAV
jgi:pyruvate formate lyase activating enzyme